MSNNKRSFDNSSSIDPSHLTSSSSSFNKLNKKVKFEATQPSGLATSSKKSINKKSIEDEEEEEDELPAMDLECDELNQVGKSKRIKTRVNVDGYDSDSSTENNEVRSKKNKKKDKDDDDDDDMFGDHGSDQDCNRNNKKDGSMKNSRFEKLDVGMRLKAGAESKDYLDLGDIEGQEFDQDEDDEERSDKKGKHKLVQKDHDADEQSDGDEYSDEEEDYVPGDEFANADDAPRARRKSKKGMGYMLSKFNMAEELREGRMTADGSYVASAQDPQAIHDNWLEGVNSKKTIKQAREAKRRREEELKQRAARDGSNRSRKDCYLSLLNLIQSKEGQTVSQILCKLGNEKKKIQEEQQKKKKIVKKRTVIDDLVPESIIEPKPTKKEEEEEEEEEKVEEKNKKNKKITRTEEEIKIDEQISEITDLSSTLMSNHGELDIYDMTFGSILGILKNESLVPRDFQPILNKQEHINNNDNLKQREEDSGNRKSMIVRPSEKLKTIEDQMNCLYYYRFKKIKLNVTEQQEEEEEKKKGVGEEVGGEVYGPFEKQMILNWFNQGFFNQNHQNDVDNHHQVLIEFKMIDRLNSTNSSSSDSWGSFDQIVFPS